MTTTALREPAAAAVSPPPLREITDASLRAPLVCSALLAAVTAAGAAGTFFVPEALLGPAVMRGSARGTALVMLAVALPTLMASMAMARRGSVRAVFLWLGTVAYLAYSSVLLLFATPFNRFFLLYEAMLGLAVAAIAVLLSRLDAAAIAARLTRVPARLVAVWMWVSVGVNVLAWLRNILPELGTRSTPDFLAGTGMTTNPIYVQDLAGWLPLAAVAACWLWQRKPRGYLTAGGVVCFWLIESVSVVVDQYFGSHADPSSTIATMSGAWMFVAFTVLGVVPVVLMLRRVTPG